MRTDEPEARRARIEKMTELAQRVWPDERGVRIIEEYGGYRVVSGVLVGEENVLVAIYHHPRALYALDATLLMLADDAKVVPDGALRDAYCQGIVDALKIPPFWVDELWSHWTAWATQHEMMAQETSDAVHIEQYRLRAEIFRQCATELRERAREVHRRASP